MVRGAVFLLRSGDGGSPQVYMTAGGFRATSLAISGEAVAVTTKDAGQWRELLSGAGARSVSVVASGIFLGSAAEASIRSNAMTGTVNEYELSFEGGERMRGRFLITKLDYAGDFNGERNYSIALESSGPVGMP